MNIVVFAAKSFVYHLKRIVLIVWKNTKKHAKREIKKMSDKGQQKEKNKNTEETNEMDDLFQERMPSIHYF